MTRRTAIARCVVAAIILPALSCGCSSLAGGGAQPKAANAMPSGAVEETIVVGTKELYQEAHAAAAPDTAKPTSDSTAPAKPPEALKEELFSSYRIGPSDLLTFRSFDDDSLNTEVTVRYDGCISLPLVPDIKVGGLTREEAMAQVRKVYAAYYADPLINLAVLESRSKKVSVIGDVNHPADYAYNQPMTLLDTITAAGGLRIAQSYREPFVNDQGQLTKAFLIRHVEGERQVLEFNLRNLHKSGSHPSDAMVLPGDIVYVPEGLNLAYVLGAVRSPGVFPITENTTILQLLAKAGSFDEVTGNLKQVVLIRQDSEESAQVMLVNVRRILKTGQDIRLQPGDILYVPRKWVVNLQTFVAQTTGVVSPVLSLYQQACNTYYAKDLLAKTLEGQASRESALTTLQQTSGSSVPKASGPLATMEEGGK